MEEPADKQPPKRRRRKKAKGKPRGIHVVRKNDKTPFKYDAKPVIEAFARNAGRPSNYTPLRGIELFNHMATGLSVTAASAAMGFDRATIQRWAQKNPDFAAALNRAKCARVLYGERKLLASVDGPAVAAAIFMLKNADPDEWRERREQVTSTAPDDPLLAYLKSIDGRVLRPAEPPTIDVSADDLTTVTTPAPRNQIEGPPRPISPGRA
jgi:hypothetical protein